MKKVVFFIAIMLGVLISYAQSEEDQIRTCIEGYIEGTSYNNPDRVSSAFMPGAQMFLDHPDKPLFVMTIEEYASRIDGSKEGEFNGRTTNIISIDRFEGIATAKLEVVIPSIGKRFIDLLLLKKLEDGWKIISKTAAGQVSNKSGRKALLVLSNTTLQGDSELPAGNSFSEVVLAYDGYEKAGYHVDIMSPLGGQLPLAYINPGDSVHAQFLYDSDIMYALKNAKKPADIDPSEYDIVQYTGGSGPIFDVPQNKEIQKIVMHIYEKNNGVVAAVCHGTAGIVNLKTSDGEYLVKGKNVNGVPDRQENKSKPYYQQYPFVIEELLKQRGGNFRSSDRDASNKEVPHMEVDGRLVTGQNYLSTEMVTLKSIEISKQVRSKTN